LLTWFWRYLSFHRRQPGWLSKEKVPRQGHLYLYPRVQGGYRSYGSGQPDLEQQVQRETDRASVYPMPTSSFLLIRLYLPLLQGYLAITLLLHENSDLIRLVINSIRKDLDDRDEINNCLALHAIANIGGKEMAESLAEDVHRLLLSA
jgi:hypothetical protein